MENVSPKPLCDGRRALREPLLAWSLKALEFDLSDTVLDVEKAVATQCGHLVYLNETSKVRLVHSTTRPFLTDTAIGSEFVFDKAEAHQTLALACLKGLRGVTYFPLGPSGCQPARPSCQMLVGRRGRVRTFHYRVPPVRLDNIRVLRVSLAQQEGAQFEVVSKHGV